MSSHNKAKRKQLSKKKDFANDKNKVFEFKHPYLQPNQIIDVNYGKNKSEYEFTIFFKHLQEKKKNRTIVIANLKDFALSIKLWLLSKFKKNLEELMMFKEMEMFARVKLEILKNFCNHYDIQFETLFVKNDTSPKTRYACAEDRQVNDLQNSDQNIKETEEDYPLSERNSLSMEHFRVKKPKWMKIRELNSEIDELQRKYKRIRKIGKERLLKDLDFINVFSTEI